MYRTLSRLATVGRVFTRRCNVLIAVGQIRTIRPVCFNSSNPIVKLYTNPFLDNENINLHNTMINDPAYNGTVTNPYTPEDLPTVTDKQFHDLISRDFNSRTSDEIYNDFLHISSYVVGKDCNLLDSEFDGLRNNLIAVLPNVTDDQLMSIFKLIPLWRQNNKNDPIYYKLWSQFDKQCVERHKKWSLNKLLLCMDHWYIMRLSKLSNFVWVGIRKLGRKPSRLTPKQLVQMMFYANTSRKFLPILPLYDIEQEICAYYDDYNINELGIVCLGFFKSQTPIRNQQLIGKLFNSVIKNISNINSIELAAFLKILRYCTNHQNADSMYQLMDVLVEKIYKVQLVCCMHMALLGTNLLIKHEDLLKKISQRLVNEISQARIKDIERITLALTMLNFDPQTTPCIFKTVINELRSDKRINDFEHYTRCYISILPQLAVYNLFPYDCISKALQTETLQKCFGKRLSKFNIPLDIVRLNNSMIIECPDYSGNLLPDSLRVSCSENLAWHLPDLKSAKQSINDRVLVKLYNVILQLFKDESYLHLCYPLPHHPKPDIIFCINDKGKPVSIPETIKIKTAFTDLQKLPELGKWFAVMLLVRNSVLFYSNTYNGLTQCKIRQFKLLGYEPILFTIGELYKENNNQKIILEKFKSHGISLN